MESQLFDLDCSNNGSGDADGSVPVDESRKMFASLKKVGANVQYTELPGVNHNAWDPAYSRADVIEWMLKQRRR